MSDTPTGSPMEQFAELPWHPDVQPWASEVATRVNDYEQKTNIAAANQQAGNDFVRSMSTFRNGMLARISQDPHFVHTALDIIPPTVAAVINNNSEHPDEQRQPDHDALVSDLSGAVARHAVQSAADRSEDGARSLLGNDRISGLLSDEDKTGLDTYINMQSMARGADAAVQQQQQAKIAGYRAAATTTSRAASLLDPDTGELTFPPGWAQAALKDPATPPADTATLLHLYGRLSTNGDAPQSDPMMVHDLVNRIAAGGDVDHLDVLNNAGTNLRFADAVNLARGAMPMDTQTRGKFGQLADTIQQAKTALMGPDGENGVAGHAAWGRFVNWVLPAIRQGGVDFSADAHPLNWLPRFAPTGDDVVPRTAPEGRKSLGEIFGR